MARLVVDRRERQLIKLLGSDAVDVQTLDVGDVVCRYEGSGWVAERKTANDLAQSIKDGRWAEQKDRLYKSGLTVVYLIEGNLRDASFTYESLLGACVSAELEGAHVFRTWDIKETTELLGCLQRKMIAPRHAPTDTLATNKRKKDGELETIWTRQIACIPRFSEAVSRAILQHFGSLRDLQDALRAPAFPDVPIRGEGALLGKARIEKLRAVFL